MEFDINKEMSLNEVHFPINRYLDDFIRDAVRVFQARGRIVSIAGRRHFWLGDDDDDDEGLVYGLIFKIHRVLYFSG